MSGCTREVHFIDALYMAHHSALKRLIIKSLSSFHFPKFASYAILHSYRVCKRLLAFLWAQLFLSLFRQEEKQIKFVLLYKKWHSVCCCKWTCWLSSSFVTTFLFSSLIYTKVIIYSLQLQWNKTKKKKSLWTPKQKYNIQCFIKKQY